MLPHPLRVPDDTLIDLRRGAQAVPDVLDRRQVLVVGLDRPDKRLQLLQELPPAGRRRPRVPAENSGSPGERVRVRPSRFFSQRQHTPVSHPHRGHASAYKSFAFGRAAQWREDAARMDGCPGERVSRRPQRTSRRLFFFIGTGWLEPTVSLFEPGRVGTRNA